MSDFRKLSDRVLASPQIDAAAIVEAVEQGVTLIVNNRPDGEEAGQPAGAAIAQAARAAGLEYLAIPIGQAGFGPEAVEAMAAALKQAEGKILAYCRSGTRSTLLWALARASEGDDPAAIAESAAAAGYDIAPVRPAMEALAARSAG
ncbi:TIGR01244 family phosphatase [Altererythrobacter sp. SALINAS58]|uniref:TIGR01244 family sulfur transferase n=1 Tax=Alteripontixanthobacter muriae TaxID=2705546 RepID=UPI001576AB81|nr:TIGR01244 family sulfur transferase [Alteripontixanthobacter muriae]NTZ43660.1 TIGR01244 family phosphatase [Alteripontixanthobacter muriae]